MFFKKFKNLCEKKGVKPTPVIKTLGISTSYEKDGKTDYCQMLKC